MSSKKVWLATVATLAGVALVGSAFVESASAQYRGYGYRNDEAPDYYYGTPYSPPGYDPYGDPDGGPAPRVRRGDYDRGGYGDRGYGGPPEDYDRGARRMPYADPLNGAPQSRRDLPRGGDYSYGYDNPNAGGPGYDQGPYGGSDPNHKASDTDLGDSINRTTRTEVENRTRQPPGTIVINTAERHLYYTQPNGMALMYGIGVGRQGFTWKGSAKVERKAEWPDWIPPSDMLKRRPDLPTRMSGGIENPLGARAMYLFQGSKDTMFRIHGTNEPDTIGKAVSSGCIRMMNADVIDLYRRVPVGTKVVVL